MLSDMAYNEDLADRVREVVYPNKAVVEIKMFGGLCFTERGNMFAGVLGDELLLRVGPEGHGAAMRSAHARPMDFTGKPMKGFVMIAPGGTKTKASLKKWIDQGLGFTSALPPKPKKR